MKIRVLTAAAMLCMFAGSTAASQPAAVVNHEAPGNLQGRDLGCMAWNEVQSSHSAVDLFESAVSCVEAGNIDQGAQLLGLASAYGHFDILRVKDQTAHQALQVLKLSLRDRIGDENAGSVMKRIQAFTIIPEQLEPFCANLRRIGAPTYTPTWMTQHGMGAFVGGNRSGLEENFEPERAWQYVLSTFVRCPAE